MTQFLVYDADRQTVEDALKIEAVDALSAASQFAGIAANTLDRTITVQAPDGTESVFGKPPHSPVEHLDD